MSCLTWFVMFFQCKIHAHLHILGDRDTRLSRVVPTFLSFDTLIQIKVCVKNV